MKARRTSSLVPGRGRDGMLETTRRCRRIATRDRALRRDLPVATRRADSEEVYQTDLNLTSGTRPLFRDRNPTPGPTGTTWSGVWRRRLAIRRVSAATR